MSFLHRPTLSKYWNIWGLISTVPTSLLWIVIGGILLTQVIGSDHSLQATLGYWVVILILSAGSPMIGFYCGSIGENVRQNNPEVFDSRPHTILGVKWYHWFWLFIIIHWVVWLGTYSLFQGVILFFGTGRTPFLVNVNSTIATFLVGIALALLGLSLFKIFHLLLKGYEIGISKARISLRVLGWLIIILFFVSGFQILTGYIMFF